MSTVNKTSNAGVFNQQSMGQYNQLQSGIGSNLQDFMNNPLQSSFFNTQLQMAQRANMNQQSSRNQMVNQNATVGGFTGNTPAFLQSQMANNARTASANNSNSFNSLLLGANQLRFGATQSAMGYKPLQTGSNTTQSQGGLGSWLPQLAGAALGAVNPMKKMMSAFGGGGQTSGEFETGFSPQAGFQQANGGNMASIGGMSTYDNSGGNTLIGPQ